MWCSVYTVSISIPSERTSFPQVCHWWGKHLTVEHVQTLFEEVFLCDWFVNLSSSLFHPFAWNGSSINFFNNAEQCVLLVWLFFHFINECKCNVFVWLFFTYKWQNSAHAACFILISKDRSLVASCLHAILTFVREFTLCHVMLLLWPRSKVAVVKKWISENLNEFSFHFIRHPLTFLIGPWNVSLRLIQ